MYCTSRIAYSDGHCHWLKWLITYSDIGVSLKIPWLKLSLDISCTLVSLLISTYQNPVIGWAQVYVINMGYGSVFCGDKQINSHFVPLIVHCTIGMTNLKYGNTLILNIWDWPLWEDTLPYLWSVHNNLTSKTLQVYGEGNIWIIHWAMWSNRTHLELIEIWWSLISLCCLISV